MTRIARIFCCLSWLPLALWIGAEIYVAQFEGWGQWAAAPILLVPFFLSIGTTVAGILLVRAQRPDRRATRYLSWCALVAAIPALWIVFRAWLR